MQFLLPEHNLPLGEFQGSWYEYELRGDVKTDSIINTAGIWVSLKDLSADPATPDPKYVFRLSDQSAISRDCQATMVFRMTLNGLNRELSYPFTVKDYPLELELSRESVERGGDLVLTVQGTPFMLYDIKLPVPPAGEDYPRFEGGGWHDKISDYHVRAYPEWDGEVQLKIAIPEKAPVTSYRVSATGPGAIQPVTATFSVVKKVMTLVFDEPEEKSYIIGNTIKLSGTLRNIESSRSDLIPIYLFVTGPNLPANGAPLTDPRQGVVDGEPDTFTVAHYSPITGRWEYNWETLNFHCEEGTYTVHANIQPIGYRKSCYPGAPGSIDGEVPPSWEYALISPTVHAKFDEGTGGVFARGDFLYSWWYARGSPGSGGATGSTGHMKWYVFGANFKYADCNPRFPLGDDGGTYGIAYSRNFTYELSPGDYFIVYHHPGLNNRFDVLPENELYFRGHVRELFCVDDGRVLVDLGNLDSKNAATALLEALDSVNNDDIYVMDTFTIEDPLIRIEPPGELVVGDELVVKGATNLAGGGTTPDGTNVADTLTLTVTSLDMHESGKANTVMKIPFDRATPGSYSRVTGVRSFSYGSIDTSTWYPGKYMVTVWCKDVNHKETCTFELLAEGSERKTAGSDAQNPFPHRTPATPASTPYVEPEFTPISLPAARPTTQSPGFEALIAVTAVFGALIMIRRR
ncbi:PGF-CTERM sorting domain-containing protein [Methanofollis sp.]|uniref:PGF-CTERM sorting domain-containing protein n=1 Tax=Methanofollis sp. TaxID=2052835 RepID=UPI002625D94D|nr:PGF-CTERM sorting domain-containing protein [Methanofollis sp.]